jgi:hypothetical protein
MFSRALQSAAHELRVWKTRTSNSDRKNLPATGDLEYKKTKRRKKLLCKGNGWSCSNARARRHIGGAEVQHNSLLTSALDKVVSITLWPFHRQGQKTRCSGWAPEQDWTFWRNKISRSRPESISESSAAHNFVTWLQETGCGNEIRMEVTPDTCGIILSGSSTRRIG